MTLLPLELAELPSPHGAAAARQCTSCGRVWTTGEARCPACRATGVPIAATEREPAVELPRHARPLWLVGLLMFLTDGLYVLVWGGLTWAELGRALGNPRMRPVRHALSLLVPLFGLLQLYEHAALIRDELNAEQARRTVRPAWVVGAGVAAATATIVVGRVPGLTGAALLLVAVALPIWSLVHLQAGLNAYWDTLAERRLPRRVGRADGLALLGALLWFGISVWRSMH